MPKRPTRPPGPAPDEAALRQAALNHLARFAATEAGLVRVLGNRIRRWARAAEAAGLDTTGTDAALAIARRVAAAMVQAGAVDDAAFAEARARRLARGGRSRRAAAAHLAAKGIAAPTAAAALAAAPDEADAALAFCRRRRIGPFSPLGGAAPDAAQRLRWLGMLARAGFSRDVAERALRTDPGEAVARIAALRA